MSKTIPRHPNCKNCGQCCGLIPAYADEVAEIRKYIVAHPGIIDEVSASGSNCPFRDSAKSRCRIYPVRPLICRLMGVAKGLPCPHGNSRNIDGRKFMHGRNNEDAEILNFVDWREAVHE